MQHYRLFIVLSLMLENPLHAAAYPLAEEIRRLEESITKNIMQEKPAVMIAQELDRLADLYEGQGNTLRQLETLQQLIDLKGLSKEKRKTYAEKRDRIFSEYKTSLEAQIGQTADKERQYQAQLAMGKLLLLRSGPNDQKLADTLFKTVLSQSSYYQLKHAAAVALGDLKMREKNVENAAIYYKIVPEGDPSWPLAQAKLGILLMRQNKDGAADALENGVEALNDRSISPEDRLAGTFLAAERLRRHGRWQDAAKYFVQIADESTQPKMKWDADFETAMIFKSNQPQLAQIYFKKAYDLVSSVKEFTPEQQANTRITLAKELADSHLEQKGLDNNKILLYLEAALNEAQSLIAKCTSKLTGKTKKGCEESLKSANHVLTGPLGFASVLSKAETKMREAGEDVKDRLAKIRERYEKLVEKLEEHE